MGRTGHNYGATRQSFKNYTSLFKLGWVGERTHRCTIPRKVFIQSLSCLSKVHGPTPMGRTGHNYGATRQSFKNYTSLFPALFRMHRPLQTEIQWRVVTWMTWLASGNANSLVFFDGASCT
jgi:hypothetical protein